MPVKQQKHSVILQMIYSLIPFVDIWAFYRIEKLRVWIGIFTAYFVFGMIWGFFFPNPSNNDMIFEILLTVSAFIIYPLVMRHFTIKWNNLDTIRRKGSFSSDDNV
jgi:hypothetical protein